ncbi:hypothetical protein KBB96_00100 [Luteolibacter ambystomatis]|uniref:Uncharacterized protein n=1 Tax=Luteolibacter ambystomatis TaxID=2824561 RepID=A0A975IZI1_9BACT|nr:hypothetical protein [Luteolibacter ambystomatis]QUE51317.1 hypothetical protein KBB96_00100 [Luteolibacter ambystomatis]
MPSSRDRFSASDFAFLGEVLAPAETRSHLSGLWDDPEALREMLDLKQVFRAVLDSPSALQVSPAFYFYVMVRHVFLQAGLTDPALANYVAGVLAERVGAEPGDVLKDAARGITHAADFLSILETSSGRLRFHLQLAAGNQFLVLTGMYPAFLRHRAERRGAPDVEFYEAFACRAFRGAADNPEAPASTPRHLLGALSEALPTARRSLNRMAEEFVFLGE